MKLIHLSDWHVGKKRNAETLMALIKKGIIPKYRFQDPPPVVIVTGDVVDDGNRRWQYKKSGELASALEAYFPVLMVPGNHDYGWNGIFARKQNIWQFAKYLKQSLDFPLVHHIQDCFLVGLDSMEDEQNGMEQLGSEGEIGKRQLHELDAELYEIRHQFPRAKIVVYLHPHPFFFNRFLRLKDADEFKEVIRGRIDVLLFGHQHLGQRLAEKEDKYGISVIVASGSSPDLVVGGLQETKNQPVFCFDEIDVEQGQVRRVEISALSLGIEEASIY